MRIHRFAGFLLLVEVHHILNLPLALLLGQGEFVDKPLLSDHDALLVDDVVELTVVFFKNLVLVVVFVLVIVVLLLARQTALVVFFLVFFCTFAPSFAVLVVELVENVLDLSLELLVN